VSRAGLTLSCVLLAGCAVLRPRPSGPLVPAELPALEDDLDLASLRAALERTRPVYARAGDAGALAAADRLLAILDTTADPEARREAVARTFRVVRFRDPALLTAYYEPELAARFARDAIFRYPLYARPPDLIDVEPRTLDEIGQVYGVTRERIRQIESKTMSKLRHPSRSQVLRDYLD